MDIFKAERINGEIVVKAIVEKDLKGNVKVKLPSFRLISELRKKLLEAENRKRNL